MYQERFHVLKVFGGVAVLISAAVGVIQIFGFITAASSDLSATLEKSYYQLHPGIIAYVNKDIDEEYQSKLKGAGPKDTSSDEDGVDEEMKGLGFEKRDMGRLIASFELQSKFGISLGPQVYRTYRIVNAGDKAALGATLVNVGGDTALIEGDKKPVELKGKTTLELGRIAPRSTKVIYVWASPYIDDEDQGAFVEYDGGAVDVEILVPLGGVYKHLYRYSNTYLIFLGSIFLAGIFVGVASMVRSAIFTRPYVPEPRRKRRRSRNRQQRPRLSAPSNDQ